VAVTAERAAWRRGAMWCALAAVLFGATTPLASRIADDMNAATLAGLLYLGAALAVLPVRGRRGSVETIRRRGGGRLVVVVAVGGLLGPVLLAGGLARTPAATASLLLNLELVVTTALAALFFGEHIGRRVTTGAALVVVAGVILAWSEAPELRFGALFIAGACICWGLDNCVTAGLDTLAPREITLAKGVVAGATNVVVGVALAAGLPSMELVVEALVLGAIGYGASITFWVRGARELGAARGQVIFSAAPFIGVIVAWTVLDDNATTAQAVALPLALAGVLLVLRSSHEHPHAHTPIEHEHEHTHDAHHRHHDTDESDRHNHAHIHRTLVHAHPHVPDLHHRHRHG
jgi:drug/metabolite transporter (DMT)-like permease